MEASKARMSIGKLPHRYLTDGFERRRPCDDGHTTDRLIRADVLSKQLKCAHKSD